MPDVGVEVWIEGLPTGALATVVMSVEDDVLVLDAPRRGGRRAWVPENRDLTLTFKRGGVPCIVPIVIERGARGEPSDRVRARATGPPVRNQRRAHFRVPDILDVAVAELAERPEAPPLREARGVTVNLSEGGVLVRVQADIRAGSQVRLEIALPHERIEVRGRVVRTEPPEAGERRVGLGIAFSDVDRQGARALRQHVLERQRELRRRELGLD